MVKLTNFEKAKILAKEKLEKQREINNKPFAKPFVDNTKKSNLNVEEMMEQGKKSYATTKNNVLEDMFKEDILDTFVRVPILETKFSRTFEHLNSGAPIMFISACHSLDNDRKYTDEEIKEQNEENVENSKKLNRELDNLNLFYIKTNGHWIVYNGNKKQFTDNPEYTFMVVGYDDFGDLIDFEEFKEIGIKLCKEYEQYAVMVGRKINEGYDFKYYKSDGSIDVVFNNGYKIDNGNKINELLNKYNEKINSFQTKKDKGEKLTKEEKAEFRKLKKEHYGSTEIHNKNNTNRRLNIVFENTVTMKGPSFPHNMGITLFTEAD